MVDPRFILDQLRRSGTIRVAINDLVALREAADLAAAQLPVKWEFDPSTPACFVDYLAGAGQGAVDGGFKGIALGLLISAIFPPAILAVPVAEIALGGAVLGALHGANRVRQGWRIRVVTDRDPNQPQIEVSLAR